MTSSIMKTYCLLLVVFVQQTVAVLYRLNASDHTRMPPVYHLDPYERCLHRPGGVYCDVELTLVSDEPNKLYDMITEYSEHTSTHFNHTKLQYGICVTRTCEKYYMENVDLKSTLEECLNESLWSTYGLQSIVSDVMSCDKFGDTIPIDKGDILVAVMILILLTLNLAGSFYGYCYFKDTKEDNKYLLCFSLRHNWSKLWSPPTEKPPLAHLRGLNGMRTLTMMLVILGHSFLVSAVTVENEQYFELMYDNIWYHIFFNGTFIVQTFFVISGFLVMFKFLMYSEDHKITWSLLPKGIISRWLRLTPTYAVMLAVTTTWVRFYGSGPLWSRIVEVEVLDCRREWWYNLLYVNNYIDNSQCMPQTWYLAADMQLHILGLIALVCFTSSKGRKVVLGVLLLIGLIVPAIHTYAQNLNAVLIVSPEVMTSLFVEDPTFNNVYKRGHTNLANFVLGMGTGWLIYYSQKNEHETTKYRKYRFLFWGLWPAMLGIVMLGSVFYMDRPQPPLYVRVVYATLVKPCFGIFQVLLIIGMIFKVEDLYRGILEWPGWTPLARLSYCSYLVHVLHVRVLCGLRTALTHMSIIQTSCDVFGIICLTLLLAMPLWLLVESPLTQSINLLTSQQHSKKKPSTVVTDPNESSSPKNKGKV